MFRRDIRNGLPQLDPDKCEDTKFDIKFNSQKDKIKIDADKKRNAKISDIKLNDKVLLKTMQKKNKLSTEWESKVYKVIKL